MKRIAYLTTLVLGAGLVTVTAQSLVTSRAALGGNDLIDWGALGPEFLGVAQPFTITSVGALETATVTQVGSPWFERRNQGSGWGGNFLPGENLLWSQGANGPVTLQFATPVFGVGMQIQANFYGPFTGTLDVFDGGNNLIASFTEAGVSDGAGDGSAIFIGVTSPTANISKITVGVLNGATDQDMAMNQVSLVIPEPQTCAAVAGLGLLGLIAFRRSKD